MLSVIKNGDELGKLTLMPYFEMFSRFDETGKINFLKSVYGRLLEKRDFSGFTDNEREFAEAVAKGLKASGVMACLAVVEGEGTYSWKRGLNIIDVAREADKILNRKHEGKPKTALDINYYKTIQECYD